MTRQMSKTPARLHAKITWAAEFVRPFDMFETLRPPAMVIVILLPGLLADGKKSVASDRIGPRRSEVSCKNLIVTDAQMSHEAHCRTREQNRARAPSQVR